MNTVRDQRWSAAEVSRLITLLNGERHYLEIIFDALPVAVAIVAGDLTIRAANGAFATLFGVEEHGAGGIPLIRATGDRHAPAAVLDGIERGDRSVVIAKQTFLWSRISASDDILLVHAPATAEPKPAVIPPKPAAVAAPEPKSNAFDLRMGAVSQLAGGLSHELNNILTIITSYCHLALEQIETPAAATEDIHAILKAAEEASHIGTQLVHIGGRHVTRDESVDLNAIIASLDWLFEKPADQRVRIEVHTDPNLPRVAGDRQQLEAAVDALVRHAAEAAGEEGMVAVRTSASDNGNAAELVIEDDRKWPPGTVGMQLFEPYATYPGSKKGAGLTLAASYSILRHCGGDLKLAGTVDRTTIAVRLPAAPKDQQRTATETRASTRTVLLVDDKADVRSAIRQMLERQGYNVIEAGLPEQALRALESTSQIDVLLSDIDMPQMSGRELARRASRIRPALKVVMMSGYADEKIDLASAEDGRFVFLQKPFSPDRLVTTLRRVLDGA